MDKPERLSDLEQAFDELRGRDTLEQQRALDAFEPGRRAALQRLLRADRAAGEFLETPPVGARLGRESPVERLGRRLGAYVLERELGRGGMGRVFLASRADGTFEQRVAVKVLDVGLARADLHERFAVERRILATLEHPGIARLIDGGSDDDGVPYLVMEWVDGQPIDVACEARGLDLDARLALLLDVCAAVAYAHRNLIVHRDLKPSNILVAADGRPRLLDFGIAKLLAADPGQAQTTTGRRLLTPSFASPEQISGGLITTASDVYSLGVLSYLLLTGRSPYRYDRERLGALEQAIVEHEPEAPSVALRRLPSEQPGDAWAGRARAYARRLAGDLDTVVLKALAKDPARRYSSVEALAADVERYRLGRPVLARRATTFSRARKFVLRHRVGTLLAAAALLVIASQIVGLVLQARSLARERDALRRERDTVVRVTRLVQELIALADPSQARGETLTVREMLEHASRHIERDLSGQPEVQAGLGQNVGEIYVRLGLLAQAQPLLERALERRRQVLGDAHALVGESLLAVGALHDARGDFARAEAAFDEALRVSGALDEPRARDLLEGQSLNGLGSVHYHRARFEQAAVALNRALALFERHLKAPTEEQATALANLGMTYHGRGDFAAAEPRHRQALAMFRGLPGHDPQVVVLLNNLAQARYELDDVASAQAGAREALALARRIYGAQHPWVAWELDHLAGYLRATGDYDQAEPLAREALAQRRKLLGPQHHLVAHSLSNLGRVLDDRGDPAAARPLYEQAAALFERTLGREHPLRAAVLIHLAGVACARGDLARGRQHAEEALAIRRGVRGEAHPESGEALARLGRVERMAGHLEQAEELLREGSARLRAALGPEHARSAAVASEWAQSLLELGRRREAEPLLRSAHAALARRRGAKALETRQALARLQALDAVAR